MSKARIFGLGFGILLIVAAFGVVLWQTANMPATSTAFAQGAATATPGASSTTTTAQQQAPIGDTFWTLLAGKLGVSADDLKTKAVEARKEMIDQAVKDGRITQEQGDAIKQRIDANNIIAPIPLGRGFRPQGNGNPPQGGNQPQPRRGPFGGFGNGNRPPVFGNRLPGGFGHGGFGANLQELETIAKAVKLEPKALIEQLSQGKTLAEVAKAQGVDEATVKQAIIDFRKAQIDQQLALGLISEVQANEMKSRLTPESIDLSRGYRFNFQIKPGQEKSSEAIPNLEWGEAFGIAPDEDVFFWGDEFAMPFEMEPSELFGEIQTQ